MFLPCFPEALGKTGNKRTLCKNTETNPYSIRPTGFFYIVPSGLYRFSLTNPYSIRPTIKFRTKKSLGTMHNNAHYTNNTTKFLNNTRQNYINNNTIQKHYHDKQRHNTTKGIQHMATTSPKSTIITLRLSHELHNLCKTVADKEEIPVSYVIRRAIKAGLKIETKPEVKSPEVKMPDWE